MFWLWIWGIVTAVALVVEFLTSDLVTIWFAAGGLTTLLVVALAPGLAWYWQLIIFNAMSVVLLVFARKICIRLLHNYDDKEDNIVGLRFKVGKVVSGYSYHKVNGVLWQVMPCENQTLQEGKLVEVCDKNDNKLIVKQFSRSVSRERTEMRTAEHHSGKYNYL